MKTRDHIDKKQFSETKKINVLINDRNNKILLAETQNIKE